MNKYIKFKDKIKRSQLVTKKNNKFIFKYLGLVENLNLNWKFKIMLKNQNFPYMNTTKNRCLNSNYARALISFTKTSKVEFRKAMGLSLVTGFRKASW